jgi:serine phosphatase RsbU (regulator of sigma subunit)
MMDTSGEAATRTRSEPDGPGVGPGPESDAVARLAQALAGAVRPAEVLDVVADAAASLLNARSINVSILDKDRQVLRLVVSRRSSPQVRMQFETYPLDAPYPTRDALTLRQPVLLAGVEDRDRRYPALAQVPVSEVAWAVLPLIAEDRALGTIGLGWAMPQAFDEAQMTLCQGVADLTAAALSRAQLFDDEEQARTAAEDLATRLGLLQNLTSQLSEATDLATVGDLVVGAGLRALDADAAAIGLLDDGSTFTSLASVGIPSELLPRWSTHDVSGLAQVCDLRATLRPVVVTSRADGDTRYPDLGRRDAFQAIAAVPLVTAGTLVGIMGYAWNHPRAFDSHDLAFLTAIASHAATAIDRSRLLDRANHVAETLQRALLPETLTDLHGWDLASCYIPALEGTSVGGDWYDSFVTTDGRVVLALGDVAGKGIRAAAVMGAVRSALRAYATLDPAPATVLARLDDYFAAFKDGEMATVAVAVLDPETGDLTYACAGHLPPLLVDPQSARWLDEATSPPLGTDIHTVRPQVTTRIAPGQVLLLYSDGLVERRDEDLYESLVTLAERAAALPGHKDLRAAIDLLIKNLDAPSKVIDDTALMALRRHPWPRDAFGPVSGASGPGGRRRPPGRATRCSP